MITRILSHRRALSLALPLLFSLLPTSAAELFTGSVKTVPEDRQALTVISEDGNEMTVAVGPGDYAIARPGWAIRGQLVPYRDQQMLQTIMPNAPGERALVQRLDRQLQKDTLRRGSRAFRSVGERIPRFALWKQDGTLFHSDSLRGNYAVINFIFTRCQAQNMCPAATRRMTRLQDLAEERGIDDLRQVSITLDPAFDTPGVFTSYAAGRGITEKTFFFLSGPARVVENLKTQLGVLAEPDEEEIIRHTLATALVDPSGEIIYRIPGSMWDPEIFLKQIEKDRQSVDS